MNEKNYYDDGKLKSEFKKNDNGQLDGIYREYYENGQLKLECTYKNGQLEGTAKEYYKNKQLSCEYNFKNGQLDGLCKEYYESGKIKEEYYCKNGKFEGTYKKYYTNGKEKSEYNYKNGRAEGTAKEYRINGDIEVEYDYKKVNLENIYEKYENKKAITETTTKTNIAPNSNINETLKDEKVEINAPKNTEHTKTIISEDTENSIKSEKTSKRRINESPNFNSKNDLGKYVIYVFLIILLIVAVLCFLLEKFQNNVSSQENVVTNPGEHSQPQAQQEVKPVIVENNTERQEVTPQSNTQTINNYDHDLEVLGKVYDEVINRGNESYLENFSSEELAIIRNTLYARKGYQFKKKEYQEYFGQKSWYNPTTTNQNILTKNEERLANIIKGYENNTSGRTSNTSEIGYENKFGRVVNDKYVGGSFIEFLRNANENEYYYLRDQFWEILDTMYVTEDNKTYYYLNDIIDQLETKADWDNSSRVISLEVKGNKMYYTVGFPKGYNANTPSWVQFEIFERKFNDGIGLRTAHISCAINGVEYKDWDAVYTIFR